jgi:alkaline phosphatase D
MSDPTFAPLDLPCTIDITHDTGLAAPTSSGRFYPQQQISLHTLDNPDIYWNQNLRNSSITWIKVLSILSIALFIDVIILTVYVYQGTEPKGSETITHHSSGVPVVQWLPPPNPTQTITKLAFGSCSNQHQPMPYWDTLVQFKPDVVVLAGDNVYGDCLDVECTTLTQAYQNLYDHASFQGVKKYLKVIATLDDHDYGQGDAHGDNPHKDIAKALFLDFFNVFDERRSRSKDGVYKSYQWGPENNVVQVILLDTRYHRSAFLKSDQPGFPGKEVYMPDFVNHEKQMLSPAQWEWLGAELEQPANVRIIVSSIQVLSDGNGYECWGMLPHERDRFESLVKQHSANSATVIVSGDRHMGGFYETNELVEMTASSWTHTIPYGAFDECRNAQECDEQDSVRLGDLVRVNNFGSVEIDWEKRTMVLSLRQTDATQMYRYKNPSGTDAGQVLQSHTYPIP